MKASEKNFIKKIKKNDQDGLLYVVDAYGWIIQSVSRKILFRYPQEQQECVNDVLLVVWEKIDAYDASKGSFQNWLAGVTRFKAIDYLRKLMNLGIHQNIEDHLELSDKREEERLLRIEYEEEVAQLMAQLSPKDQEIFQRIYLKEESVKYVAEKLQESESNIYQRISRGRKKLRQYQDSKGEVR